ncbi:hypothetical protein BDV06DRAFT_229742 [Aspergillus oleicola]
MPPPPILNLNWETDSPYNKHQRDACINRVNWDALLVYASSRNSSKPCIMLDQSTSGGVHLIRLLYFPDRVPASGAEPKKKEEIWIARIQLHPSTPESQSRLQSEINTMNLIRTRSTFPIPKIYGYSLNDNDNDSHGTNASFALLSFLPGSSAMDADGGWTDVAGIQIGTVLNFKNDDGNESFDIGPLPGIGGPFSTAHEFFEAWAVYAESRFPQSESEIRECMRGSPFEEEIMKSISAFPKRLRELAAQGRISIPEYNTGPFPLYHPDLYHSNIIIDDAYKILGVLDWEGACSVPWEIVQPPLFIHNLPRAMDDPENYDVDGWPKDEDTRVRVEERGEYVGFVREMEQETGTDGRLSNVLGNGNLQGLAYAVQVFLDPGKMGFYTRVLDLFR